MYLELQRKINSAGKDFPTEKTALNELNKLKIWIQLNLSTATLGELTQKIHETVGRIAAARGEPALLIASMKAAFEEAIRVAAPAIVDQGKAAGPVAK